MEIIHKTVLIPESRVISVTLPKNIMVGEAEMVIILNAKTHQAETPHPTASSVSTSETLKEAALSKLADLLHTDKAARAKNSEGA